MALLQCKCGSVKWTIVAEFTVGYSVPTLSLRSHVAKSMEHPEHEPRCTNCGAAQPTFQELLDAQNQGKR